MLRPKDCYYRVVTVERYLTYPDTNPKDLEALYYRAKGYLEDLLNFHKDVTDKNYLVHLEESLAYLEFLTKPHLQEYYDRLDIQNEIAEVIGGGDEV